MFESLYLSDFCDTITSRHLNKHNSWSTNYFSVRWLIRFSFLTYNSVSLNFFAICSSFLSSNYIHSVCRFLLEFTSRFSFVQNICHRRDSRYNLCFSTYLSRQNNTALFSQQILIHLQDWTHIACQVVFQGRRSCPTEPLQNHLFLFFRDIE